MKKVALLTILLLALLTTGCNKKEEISCIKTEQYEVGYTIESKVSAQKDGDNIIKEELVIEMTFEDEAVAKSTYQGLLAELGDEDINITIKGKVITSKETINHEEEINISDFVAGYQEEGYTCE